MIRLFSFGAPSSPLDPPEILVPVLCGVFISSSRRSSHPVQPDGSSSELYQHIRRQKNLKFLTVKYLGPGQKYFESVFCPKTILTPTP